MKHLLLFWFIASVAFLALICVCFSLWFLSIMKPDYGTAVILTFSGALVFMLFSYAVGELRSAAEKEMERDELKTQAFIAATRREK